MAPIALGLTLAIAGQMLHMNVDVFNSRVQVQFLWLCAALLVGISRVCELQVKSSADSLETRNEAGAIRDVETTIPLHGGQVQAS